MIYLFKLISQKDVDRLGHWASKLCVRFQPVKCNMMQLTKKLTYKIQRSYTLEGTVLENVESIKHLGVTITNDLKWNTHIINICTKVANHYCFETPEPAEGCAKVNSICHQFQP